MSRVDEILEAAYGREPTLALTRAPRVRPMDSRRALVHRAVAAAREAGLQVPTFELIWVEAPGEAAGTAVRRSDGSYAVYLNESETAFPYGLVRTTFHELQHLHDFRTGQSARMTRVEFERRAVDFAAAMMRRCAW